MKIYYFLTLISFLLISCGSKTIKGELFEIPVDIDQNISLPLSEITEILTAVELELTDKSLINKDQIKRIIIFEDNIIIAEVFKILVFNKDGKYVRSIGARGQGPGEYNFIMNLALDEKNKRLFILCLGSSRIFCYDLEGKFLKSLYVPKIFIDDLYYTNEELLIIGHDINKDSETGIYNMSALLYRLNDNSEVIDSCIFRTNSFTGGSVSLTSSSNFILRGRTSDYMYYSEVYNERANPVENVLRDTLYCLKKNKLAPELKLKFKNDGISGGSKFIDLSNIYRSSRYVFSIYKNNQNKKNKYHFCYDTKTGKGYNMRDGYTDDINGIEEPVTIYPFNHNTEMFYYLHTNMKPDDLEEPNPTLYIGRLKK